jgi:hypothetical protein
VVEYPEHVAGTTDDQLDVRTGGVIAHHPPAGFGWTSLPRGGVSLTLQLILGRYGFSDIRRIPSEDEQPDRLQMDDHHIDGMPGNQTAILITSHRSQKGGGPTRRSEGT